MVLQVRERVGGLEAGACRPHGWTVLRFRDPEVMARNQTVAA